MAEEIISLESPINAIYLIHKALRAEAVSVENMVNGLEIGGSLQPFKLAFNSWATALVYHAEQEDQYLMGPAEQFQPSEHPEPGHSEPSGDSVGPEESSAADDPSGLLARVRWTLAAQEEEMHRELVAKVEDVLTVLEEDIGTTSVILRTRQHLYRQVVALRIALEDHLDTEEALVVPMVRQRMDEQQQLELARGLLIDQGAQDPRWMMDWVTQRLTPEERELLVKLEDRFPG